MNPLKNIRKTLENAVFKAFSRVFVLVEIWGRILCIFYQFFAFLKLPQTPLLSHLEVFYYFIDLTKIRRFFENRVKIVYGFIRFC